MESRARPDSNGTGLALAVVFHAVGFRNRDSPSSVERTSVKFFLACELGHGSPAGFHGIGLRWQLVIRLPPTASSAPLSNDSSNLLEEVT